MEMIRGSSSFHIISTWTKQLVVFLSRPIFTPKQGRNWRTEALFCMFLLEVNMKVFLLRISPKNGISGLLDFGASQLPQLSEKSGYGAAKGIIS